MKARSTLLRRDEARPLAAEVRQVTEATPAIRRGRRQWTAITCAVVLAAVALGASSIRLSSGPAAGADFNGEAVAQSDTQPNFRIGLFNIHGGRGTDGQRDLARIANCLRGCDLVGLNEVLGPKPWQDTDQASELGAILGLRWLFAPTESRWWDGSFGNALLAGLPVESWQRIPLPRGGSHTHRNLVLASVVVAGRRVNVVLSHLESRDSTRRQEQLRIAAELFLSLAEPAVLMGDLNTTADDPVLARLLAEPGVVDVLEAGGVAPQPLRIDWILARGLRATAASCEDRGASDHPFYWVDCAILSDE